MIAKRCTKCAQYKPVTQFYRKPRASKKWGHFAYCIACCSEVARKRHALHREERRAESRARRLANPGYNRRNRLMRVYGMTEKDYDDLMYAQGGRCDCCCERLEEGHHNRHLDHCHTTGKVRAILCRYCNLMLGYAKEDPKRLANAIRYLTLHNHWKESLQ